MDDMVYMDVTMAEAEVKGTVNTRSRHEKNNTSKTNRHIIKFCRKRQCINICNNRISIETRFFSDVPNIFYNKNNIISQPM